MKQILLENEYKKEKEIVDRLENVGLCLKNVGRRKYFTGH